MHFIGYNASHTDNRNSIDVVLDLYRNFVQYMYFQVNTKVSQELIPEFVESATLKSPLECKSDILIEDDLTAMAFKD